MITTYRIPFSHDQRDAQEQFARFVGVATESISEPHVISRPILSYGQRDPRTWQRLEATLDRYSNAIIYLCDIESFATVLVSALDSVQIPDLQAFANYDGFADLLCKPRMVGYGIPEDFITTFKVPNSYTVLGQLPYCVLDDQTDEPNPQWFDVLHRFQTKLGPIYAYKVISETHCLDAIVHIEEPTFFLPDVDGLALDAYARRYHSSDEYLTDYLEQTAVPFGTINDGHQDDSFAVAYYDDIWQLGDLHRTLIA